MMSPKARFLAHPSAVSEHKHLVVQSSFLNALDAALLNYQHRLHQTTSADLATSAANNWRSNGAHEFVKELLALADMPSVPQRKDPDNLTKV